MKKFLPVMVAMLLLAICQSLSAQDVITLKTGEDVNVKVLEVGSTDIKYKKSDNLEGPSYTVAKSEVFMIKYQNGSKDVFNTTTTTAPPAQTAPTPAPSNVDTRKDVEAGIKNYQAQQDYDKNMRLFKRKLGSGIACTAIGVPFLISGAALVGVGVNYWQTYGVYDNPYGYGDTDLETQGQIMTVAGAVLLAVGIPLTIVGPIKIGTSFKYRKRAKEAKANLSFAPSFQRIQPAGNIYGNTAGMALRLNF